MENLKDLTTVITDSNIGSKTSVSVLIVDQEKDLKWLMLVDYGYSNNEVPKITERINDEIFAKQDPRYRNEIMRIAHEHAEKLRDNRLPERNKAFEELANDIMNLGMTLRQNQLSGHSDKSGNEVLKEFLDKKYESKEE